MKTNKIIEIFLFFITSKWLLKKSEYYLSQSFLKSFILTVDFTNLTLKLFFKDSYLKETAPENRFLETVSKPSLKITSFCKRWNSNGFESRLQKNFCLTMSKKNHLCASDTQLHTILCRMFLLLCDTEFPNVMRHNIVHNIWNPMGS